MKTARPLYALAVSLLFSLGWNAQAQTTLAVEDFDGGTPSWTNDISSQTFVDPSSSSEGLFIQASTNIGSGNTAYGRDLLGETGEPTLPAPYTFTFDPVTVTGYTNVTVSFDYYAFANADVGSYEVIVDGVGQGSVEWYNDPDTTPVQGTISVNIGSANTVALELTGTLNGASDVIELDNFTITGESGGAPTPGVIITELDGSTDVTEGGATDTFTIELNTTPTDIVNITVAGDADVTVSPMAFPLAASGVQQTITVTAVDDSDVEGNHSGSITITTTSSDADYNGLNTNFNANVTDNESVPTPVLVINEVMQNPSAVADDAGEWFEIYNPGGTDIDIEGWTISDSGTDSHTIANGAPLLVPAGGYLVLGNNADSGTNGGVTVAYSYGTSFFLGNSDDEVVLTDPVAGEVDRIEWDGGTNWPNPTGASMALTDPNADNNVGANWTTSTQAFGDGDFGTPGAANGGGPAPSGFTVTESGGSTDVTEGGATDSFDLVLDSAPTASVTVDISTPSPTEVSFSSASLTFTTTDWSTPQTVTVTAVDDSDAEGAHTTTIDFSTTSADTGFDGLSDSITANITDNEPAPTFLYNADFGTEDDGFPDHTTSSPPAAAPASVNGGSATSPEGRWTASYDTAPSTDTTANEFSVNGGVLRIQDWGDQDARFESFSIDVSGVSSINISATGVTVGSDVQNGTSEFFQYFYTLDGGPDLVIDVPLSGDTAGTAVNYIVNNLDVSAASTLTVGFNFRVNDAGAGYAISEFTVTESTAPPAPNAPASFAAVGASKSSIDLSWTANGAGDSVLIAYNTTNTFDAPVDGTTYAPGGPLGANGTILGVFASSPTAHTGLQPGEFLYYKVWSVNGSGGSEAYSSGLTDFASTFEYDLQQSDFTQWTPVDVANPNRNWFIGSDGFASASGFDDGPTQSGAASEDWLISPVLDLSSVINEVFEFGYTSDFIDSIVGLELKYSTDYNGGGTPADIAAATWTDFTAINSGFDANKSTASFSETDRFDVSADLSAIAPDASVYIAFVYKSTGDGAIANTARDWNLFDPIIRGDDPNAGTITLTPGTSTLTEGTSTTLQVTLNPAPAASTTVTVYLTGSDDAELVEQGQSDLTVDVVVPDTGSATINIEALNNAVADGDRDVVVTANAADYVQTTTTITIIDDEAAPTTSDIVITEIMYDSSEVNESGDWEWVEVYNRTASPIDITGWVLDDAAGDDLTVGNVGTGSVPASGSAILYNADISAADFEAAWGAGATLIPVTSWSSLNNGGDTVALWDSVANYTGDRPNYFNAVDAVTYDDGGDFPAAANGEAIYLTGTIDSILNDTGSNWAAATSADIGTSTPVFSIRQSTGSAGNGGADFGSPTPALPDITLSASPDSFPEDAGPAASTVTVTLSQAPASYPLTVTLNSSDDFEAVVPISVEVTSGTSATFDIMAAADGVLDGDQVVTITASATGYNNGTTEVTVTDVDSFTDLGNVYISQYYEADGSNFGEFWIELCVPDGQSVDFTGYRLAIYNNANNQAWKDDSASPDSVIDLSSLGTVTASGGNVELLIAEPDSVLPRDASTDADLTSVDLFFSGDDSVVLYSSATTTVGNIVDALSITSNTANEKSIVRIAAGVGFDLNPGTSYADYPLIWEIVDSTVVDSALATDNRYIGTCVFGTSGTTYGSYATANGLDNHPANDGNGNGVTDGFEYAFRHVDPTDDGTPGAADNVISPSDLAQILTGSLPDAGSDSNVSNDVLVYSMPNSVRTGLDADVTIYVVASSVINDIPDSLTEGDNNDGTNNTDILATLNSGGWTDGGGTVSTNSGEGNNFDQIADGETVGNNPRRFIYVIVDVIVDIQ